MNSVFLSPNFPPNFANFSVQLKAAGVTVLGLADEPYEALSPQLKETITDYYRVSDMHDYDELMRALGFLTHKYGRLNHIDSHNEYWLETEARLRTDFNIPGIKLDGIERIKRKSEMKRVFRTAGLNPARGRVCRTASELKSFIQEVGYPVVAKPNTGVGAAETFKIKSDDDIERYLKDKLDVDYIIEEFISGQIISYDGLVDAAGQVIFSSSLRYSKGVMETVNEDSDIYYYTVRDLEPLVEKAGLETLKAFDVRARFFHFEFFLMEDGSVTPLEVNMRPPGGLTLNMFNYIFEFDCYKLWAQMIAHGISEKAGPRRFFTIYVGRKDRLPYALSHDEVYKNFSSMIVHHERISDVFAAAIGNSGYILRHTELPPLIEAAEAIQKRA